MDVNNEASTIKKETTEDHEEGDNEIFIKGFPKNEDDGTYFDDKADNTESNDSCNDTHSNVDSCTNNQSEHRGTHIIAWDHKKKEYVYASFPTTCRSPMDKSGSGLDGTSEEKKFYCSECPYATDRKHHMQRHELVHTKETQEIANADKRKRFQCTMCSYMTDNSTDIKRHGLKRSKIGRGKFNCKECDYTTYQNWTCLDICPNDIHQLFQSFLATTAKKYSNRSFA
nr:unnamed protein product [Callosobruchus chinensis]